MADFRLSNEKPTTCKKTHDRNSKNVYCSFIKHTHTRVHYRYTSNCPNSRALGAEHKKLGAGPPSHTIFSQGAELLPCALWLPFHVHICDPVEPPNIYNSV